MIKVTTGAFPDEFLIEPEMLLRAYASGVFPMADDAEDPEVFWIRPEKRGIIPLDKFHIPHSLQKTLRKNKFQIRLDTDFDAVIDGCANGTSERKRTWINTPIRLAYSQLFRIGHCHTVEAWIDDQLVGGLYGVTLGRAFFGESMFSRERDASKVCLAYLVSHLNKQGFILLDTQFTTPHLERFGAVEVERKDYEKLLEHALKGSAEF